MGQVLDDTSAAAASRPSFCPTHPTDHLEWPVDPTEWALRQAASVGELPPAFCTEVGRRLLLAQLEFPQWVLRRVEKVRFARDWTVSREIALDLLVRADAPRFRDSHGDEYWLVPLSLMRRRTLVNLDLRDEHGTTITMPGIRLTQQLDEATLLAAAAAVGVSVTSEDADQEVRRFVRNVIAGELPEVVHEMSTFNGKGCRVPASLRPLTQSPLFTAVLGRLRRNFTLYTFLRVSEGRHRVVWMSFDEPTDWRYRVSTLEKVEGTGHWRYRAATKLVPRYEPRHLLAALALTPTRVRLQIPGAENAASFHCEVAAPPGLQIVKATLLAGRPNEPDHRVSTDHMVGYTPTVGLHAIEVPNGSLSRVQLDLRVPAHGWLNTMLVTCMAVFAVLLSVLYHWTWHLLTWTDLQVTNVVVLLVTTSAAVATFVAQRDFGGVAARVVSGLRALGVFATTLPIFAAGFLVYASRSSELSSMDVTREQRFTLALTVLSGVVVAIAALAWRASRRGAREAMVLESPWDMTNNKPKVKIDNFAKALEHYRFDTPAVAIRSAEGWHERFAWTDELQSDAVRSLRALEGGVPRSGPPRACSTAPAVCRHDRGCASRSALATSSSSLVSSSAAGSG